MGQNNYPVEVDHDLESWNKAEHIWICQKLQCDHIGISTVASIDFLKIMWGQQDYQSSNEVEFNYKRCHSTFLFSENFVCRFANLACSSAMSCVTLNNHTHKFDEIELILLSTLRWDLRTLCEISAYRLNVKSILSINLRFIVQRLSGSFYLLSWNSLYLSDLSYWWPIYTTDHLHMEFYSTNLFHWKRKDRNLCARKHTTVRWSLFCCPWNILRLNWVASHPSMQTCSLSARTM